MRTLKKWVEKTYTVAVRRWNDKTYGNTYHSVEVWEHGYEGINRLGKIPFTYGYGDQYKVTSFELAKKAEYTGGVYDWMTDENVLFVVSDVQRRRDL